MPTDGIVPIDRQTLSISCYSIGQTEVPNGIGSCRSGSPFLREFDWLRHYPVGLGSQLVHLRNRFRIPISILFAFLTGPCLCLRIVAGHGYLFYHRNMLIAYIIGPLSLALGVVSLDETAHRFL